MQERIGILGGTFDPIHYGHLAIADEARVALGLDRVLLIPAAQQPLKPNAPKASANDRLEMVSLACANGPFEASAIEVHRPGLSYTVSTLEELHEMGLGQFFFILGTDALIQLPLWYQPARSIELAHFVAVGRPHSEVDLQTLYRALPTLPPRLTLLEGPQIDLSSTKMRERVAVGKPIRYLTPDAVVEYIDVHQIYRQKD